MTAIGAGVGAGWRAVALDALREAQQADADASIVATISDVGLLRVRVRSSVLPRAERHAIERAASERAARTCELCGGETAAVLAGVTVTIRCSDCR